MDIIKIKDLTYSAIYELRKTWGLYLFQELTEKRTTLTSVDEWHTASKLIEICIENMVNNINTITFLNV